MRPARTAIVTAALLLGCSAAPQPMAQQPASREAPPSSTATAPRSASPPTLSAASPDAEAKTNAPAAPRGATEPIQIGKATLLAMPLPPWKVMSGAERSTAPPQDYARWRQLRALRVGVGYLSILDLSEDEQLALVASEDDAQLRLYDLTNGKQVASSPVDGFVQFGRGDFVFWPSSSTPPQVVYASEQGIQLLNGATGQSLAPLAPESAWRLRWSDDRRVLGAALSRIPEQTSRLAFFVRQGQELVPSLLLEFQERVDEWDLDGTGSRLAVAYYPSETVALIDLRQHSVAWTLPGPKYGGTVDLSPDGRLIAVGGDECQLLATEDPTRQSRYTEFGNNIHQVRFSPSGDALAVSSYDGRIRILEPTLDQPTLALRKTLRHAGAANVYALRFNRDGSRLMSSSGDQTVRIWGR